MAIAITKENVDELLSSEKLVIIDFWAEWCGPCRKIGPVVEELAVEYADKAIITKCDVDTNDELAAKYGVRNIPTILFIKGGEVVEKQIGACSKADLEAKINQNL